MYLRLKSSKYLRTFSISRKIRGSYKKRVLCFSAHYFVLKMNKMLSQQPALGALTFLRSFVAGKANFCSQLLASLVHFTVVKSQAILIIRLGVTEVISAVTLYLLPAFLPRWICPGFVTGFRLCNRAGNSEHRNHK